MSVLNNLTNITNFVQTEGKLTPAQQEVVDELAGRIGNNLSQTDIGNLKSLLSAVAEIIVQNKEGIRKRVEYVNISKGIIEEELGEVDSDDTLEKLFIYREKGLGSEFTEVLNISAVEVSAFYSESTELNYRLDVLSYKKVFFENALREQDEKLSIINEYVISLDIATTT